MNEFDRKRGKHFLHTSWNVWWLNKFAVRYVFYTHLFLENWRKITNYNNKANEIPHVDCRSIARQQHTYVPLFFFLLLSEKGERRKKCQKNGYMFSFGIFQSHRYHFFQSSQLHFNEGKITKLQKQKQQPNSTFHSFAHIKNEEVNLEISVH